MRNKPVATTQFLRPSPRRRSEYARIPPRTDISAPTNIGSTTSVTGDAEFTIILANKKIYAYDTMDFLLTHTMLERMRRPAESYANRDDSKEFSEMWRQMSAGQKAGFVIGLVLRAILVVALGTVAARMALSCNAGSPARFLYAVVSFVSPAAAIPYYTLVVGSRCAAFWI